MNATIIFIFLFCYGFFGTKNSNAQMVYVKIGKDSVAINRTLLRQEFKSALSNPFRSIYLIDKKNRVRGPIQEFNDSSFRLYEGFIPFHISKSNSVISINDVASIIEDRYSSMQGIFIGTGAGVITSIILFLPSYLKGNLNSHNLFLLTFASTIAEAAIGGYIGSKIPYDGMNFPIEFIK